MNQQKTKTSTDTQSTKSSGSNNHALRYLIVGTCITVFNYILYTILSNLIITDTSLLWLCSLISTTISTFVAFACHTKITWKDRNITKTSIYKFFIWNLALSFIFSPLLTQFFSLLTPLYDFAFGISEALHLPFTHEFVLTTGTFILTSAVIMFINFLFYDNFVFGGGKTKRQKTAKSTKEGNHAKE